MDKSQKSKEEEEMPSLKEKGKKIGCVSSESYTPAKTKDVLKAIKKSHKNHSESMKLLAK